MTIFWGLPGVCQTSSTFWSITLQPVAAGQPSIWQIKGDIPSFHMRYRRLISIRRLQRKISFGPLPFFPLVTRRMSTVTIFSDFEIENVQCHDPFSAARGLWNK